MISFCIITEGKRPDKLFNLLASIEAQKIAGMDMVIAVDITHSGLLGMLRNQAISASKNEILVVADDDITLEPDFARNILDYYGGWNIMLPKILNPNGSRYWDWRHYDNANSQRMINYSVEDTGTIMPTGALVVVRKAAWKVVPWSETLRFYEPPGEDIEWGKRLHDAGYRMTSNPLCVAHHNDARYEQRGDCVMRITP